MGLIGSTSVNAQGVVDNWLTRSEDTQQGPRKYYTTLAFYGLWELVHKGLKSALPAKLATSKGKYWIVNHYAPNGSTPFMWSWTHRSLFICANRAEARQLAAYLKDQGQASDATADCYDVEVIAQHHLTRGYNIYIQVVEGTPQRGRDLPVMCFEL